MNVEKGFTLVEMLATVSVATILLAAATPSFVEMSRKNRILTYSNDFISTVNFARSEAIRRGAPVTICHSNDGETCSGSWSDGWVVFADNDHDMTVGDEEAVLRLHEGLAPGYTLGTNAAFAAGVTYGGDGAANDTGIFVVCRDGRTTGARAIMITPLRPRSIADSNKDRIPNKDADTNVASCVDP